MRAIAVKRKQKYNFFVYLMVIQLICTRVIKQRKAPLKYFSDWYSIQRDSEEKATRIVYVMHSCKRLRSEFSPPLRNRKVTGKGILSVVIDWSD